MAEMVKLKIDGKEVEVEKGASVIQAAMKAGIEVPHYCYHPGLTVAGNCRMCLVEIEKMPKLVTSCTTIASEGMVVQTGSASEGSRSRRPSWPRPRFRPNRRRSSR